MEFLLLYNYNLFNLTDWLEVSLISEIKDLYYLIYNTPLMHLIAIHMLLLFP